MRTLAVFALAVVVLTMTRAAAADPHVVSLGTVAPKQSAWGRVLSVWEEAVKKKSDGKLELRVFYNGQQGDDAAMIGKVRAGQLDGAAVSAIGLGQVHKPILALQIPGLFRTWESLDKARDAVRGELEAGAAKEGFYITLGDLGRLRAMSKGVTVRRPKDLEGHKVLSWRSDTIGPTVFQVIPHVTIVPLSAPEVLPNLRTGAVEILSAPALVAEQLQWAPQLDHIGAETSVIAIGGMAWSKPKIDALPGDLREVLQKTGKVAQEALKARIRAEDDAAFERLKTKMTVVTLSEEDRKEWKDVFVKVGARLKQGTFDPKLVDRLVELASP
ncbi:MAG TPA: TRAP transporter substrate-binding protein DctP [Polyangiaceae bacterium]|nr:TRAP transporter substrate-binding protein DctP [Polyangiaceae bacterium]